jgi:hypothetical protein
MVPLFKVKFVEGPPESDVKVLKKTKIKQVLIDA